MTFYDQTFFYLSGIKDMCSVVNGVDHEYTVSTVMLLLPRRN